MKYRFLQCLLPVFALGLVACSAKRKHRLHEREVVVVSLRDQKLALIKNGKKMREYACSTSKYGVGDEYNSYKTPLGRLQVAKKIGGNLPQGAVFDRRRPTGEVLPANAPGRDPIVTRIMWLQGTEQRNINSFGRYIYIHGTPQEDKIGTPASYGCIRMRSRDVVDLYELIGRGTAVYILPDKLANVEVQDPAALEAGKDSEASARADG